MNVELRNGTKRYSRVVALDDVSLDLKSGEIVAVVGLAGSGKSTLLRALSGSMSLSSGELLFDGAPFVGDDPDACRGLFYLPDAPPLVWDENVLRNISIFLAQYQKTEDKEVLDAVVSTLRKLDVVDKLESKVEDLSPDQAYRVTLAILFGIQPPIWIMDVPFASGPATDYLMTMMQEAAASGKTIVYSAPQVGLSTTVATRICIINKGRCYTIATPGEMRDMVKEDFLVSELIKTG